MRTWARGTSRAAVLTASFVALGVSAIPVNAFADITNGSGGVLSGNQVDAPISAPADVSGNAAALLGTGYATSHGGVKIHKRGGGGQRTSGAHGVASGNQVNAPVSLPVNVCGNAAAVLGEADAGCTGGAKINDSGQGGQVTNGSGGVLAGNQVNAPISIPVNVCGNAVAVAGDAVAGCEGGSLVKSGGHTGSGQQTSGIFGVGAGNQVNAPISVPVDICGNAIGAGAAACEGGASVRNGGHRTGRQITDGAFGVISGNQGNAPISIPLTVCGNTAAVVGQAGAFCEGGAHVRSSSGGDQQTSGAFGVLAGNQANAPLSIPAEICGNAAAVVGVAAASCNGQTLVRGPHGSGDQTSGDHGTGGGNQANTPVETPADACGNAAAVVGLASAVCQEGPGYGGYHPYARTTGTSKPMTAVTGTNALARLIALPTTHHLVNGDTLPGIDGVGTRAGERRAADGIADGLVKLPATGGALSGVMPQADGVPTSKNLPVDGLAQLVVLPPAGGLTDGLPKLGGLRGVSAEKENGRGAGKVPSVTALHGAPMTDGVVSHPLGFASGEDAPVAVSLLDTRALPVGTGLPEVNGRRATDGKGALPKTEGLAVGNVLSGVDGVSGVKGVSSLVALPKVSGLPAQDGRRAGSGPLKNGLLQQVPGTGGVPGTGAPVKVPGSNLMPSKGGLTQVNGLNPGRPVTGTRVLPQSQLVPVSGAIGPVQKVAAHEPVADGGKAGSMWTLAASGVLAMAAGSLALVRRVRVGRR